jgi:hypothetical protein
MRPTSQGSRESVWCHACRRKARESREAGRSRFEATYALTCVVCRAEFIGATRQRMYCSDECKNRRSYKVVPCSVCGEPKYKVRNKKNADAPLVCWPCRRRSFGLDPDVPMSSYKAKSQWRPVVTQCSGCSITFTQKTPAQKYCSRACARRNTRTESTTQRGYGNAHQRMRDRWRPLVAAGGVECARTDCLHVAKDLPRLIFPGEPWDLGHDRVTGTWHGPEHRDCNRSEGARYGNDQRTKVWDSGRSRW